MFGEHENDVRRLEEAIAAFREALAAQTRRQEPLLWAGTQTNLGAALLALGRSGGSIARFEDAIAAFQEALKEYTRDRDPLNWALTIGKQGVAMMHVANHRGDAAMAAIAVNQIEQALDVTRDAGHVPFAEFYETQLPQARAIRDRLQTI